MTLPQGTADPAKPWTGDSPGEMQREHQSGARITILPIWLTYLAYRLGACQVRRVWEAEAAVMPAKLHWPPAKRETRYVILRVRLTIDSTHQLVQLINSLINS